MAEPTGAINISQSMFQVDEQLSSQPQVQQQLYMSLADSQSVASWNSLPQSQGFDYQMPAYMNQAKLSTYYQDNPWPILGFSTQFGLSSMGGDIRGNIIPGHRPGNVLKSPPVPMGMAVMGGEEMQVRQPSMTNNVQPVNYNGIIIPHNNYKMKKL